MCRNQQICSRTHLPDRYIHPVFLCFLLFPETSICICPQRAQHTACGQCMCRLSSVKPNVLKCKIKTGIQKERNSFLLRSMYARVNSCTEDILTANFRYIFSFSCQYAICGLVTCYFHANIPSQDKPLDVTPGNNSPQTLHNVGRV